MIDEKAKSIHCLQDSGAEISIIQKDLIKDMMYLSWAPSRGTTLIGTLFL